jgi:hypothetical protein
MTLREVLEAIRTLPRPDRLRLADQLNRELALAPTDEPAQGALALEARGRLLVYTGPIDASELDHRADREARINASSEQPNARCV